MFLESACLHKGKGEEKLSYIFFKKPPQKPYSKLRFTLKETCLQKVYGIFSVMIHVVCVLLENNLEQKIYMFLDIWSDFFYGLL